MPSRLQSAFFRVLCDRTLMALLIAVFAVLALTMPRVTVRGDPVAIRVAAAHLLHRGRIGIPAVDAGHLGPLVDTPGQYFYTNERSGRLFSKYGALNTVLFVPPLLADWMCTGQTDPLRHTGSLVLFLNLYNMAIAMLVTWLLYRIAGMYTDRPVVRAAFVLASMFATFLWHYLRAQGSEIFQVLFFLGVYDQFVRARRALDAGPPERENAARHLRRGVVFVACLTFLKTYYILLLPLLIAFCLLPRTAPRTADADSEDSGLRERLAWLAVHAGILGGLTVLLLLAVNAYKFGSPFRTGYGQFQSTWTAYPQPEAVLGYLVRPDRSVFLHYPLLVLAAAGLVPFCRRRAAEYGFVCAAAGIYFLLFSCFVNWPGHWAYGPRFLLFVLPLLSLPAIGLFDRVLEAGWHPVRTAGRIGVIIVLGASLWAQVQVNRYEAFVFYDLKEFFSLANNEDVDDYFGHQNFSSFAHRLHSYSRGKSDFPPLTIIAELQSPEHQSGLVAFFETYLWTNYFWFGKGDPPP